jgi:hypothetical protein
MNTEMMLFDNEMIKLKWEYKNGEYDLDIKDLYNNYTTHKLPRW